MSAPTTDDPRPRLFRDVAFWGMTATQLFGAFNDNLYKQLMLLLAIPVGASSAFEQDEQGLATIVFSAPFVLFSGYAGFLADRFSKQPIIVLAKVAEIGIMLLGLAAFLNYPLTGYTGLLVVLFLMGTHSAFFGPPKYGILPEMFRGSDLPRANGVIVMTTFLAIIFGTAAAGLWGDMFGTADAPPSESARRMWVGSVCCIGIAVLGTLTALLIRRVPAARPELRFRWSALTIPPESRRVLASDRPLRMAILASCAFWLMSGIAAQAVNSLGLVQLELNKKRTSILTAMIGLGLAFGAALAGKLSRGRADPRVVRLGLWGLLASSLVLSLSWPGGTHVLGFAGSLATLAVLGVCAGCFAIPVQVCIQSRPPEGLKGRMIAVMNQSNFLAILISGLVYKGLDRLITALAWPRSSLFIMIALIVLPLVVWYRLPEPEGNTGMATKG